VKVQDLIKKKYENLNVVHTELADQEYEGGFQYDGMTILYDSFCLYPPHQHADGWYFRNWNDAAERGPFPSKEICEEFLQVAIIEELETEIYDDDDPSDALPE